MSGWGAVLAAVCCLALSTLAAAQSPPPAQSPNTQPNVILEPLRQAPRQTDQLQDTSGAAESQRLLRPDRVVTYDDVMAAPDDIDLNFAYAQTQIGRGDLHGAAATLERIILINPDLPRVRLLYAIVLYRLDNLDEAERELRAVRLYEMPSSLRAELDRYLSQIELRRKLTRYTLTVSASVQQDWNKNAASASGQTLVGASVTGIGQDIRTPLVGHDQRRSDQAYIGLARLDVSRDLGFQARHQITGAISYYRDQQVSLAEFDLSAISAELGGVYDASPVTIVPNFYRRRINLDNRHYADNTGADLHVYHQYDPETQLYVLGVAEYQNYWPIPIEQNAKEYNGWLYTTGFGVNYTFLQSMRIGLELDGIRKYAARNYNSYNGARIAGTHTWIFGNGTFLLTLLSAERDWYEEGYPVVSDLTRHDQIYRGRITYGVPVGLFFDEDLRATDLLRDLTLAVSFEAVHQYSNIINYSYNNRSASIGLSKRWEF
ncbi:MAG TPA: tetratricopeptide repeat protein [Alphaproteobacteria bacterium]